MLWVLNGSASVRQNICGYSVEVPLQGKYMLWVLNGSASVRQNMLWILSRNASARQTYVVGTQWKRLYKAKYMLWVLNGSASVGQNICCGYSMEAPL